MTAPTSDADLDGTFGPDASWRTVERTRLGLPKYPTIAGTGSISFLLGVLGLALLWLEPASRILPLGAGVAVIGLAAIVVAMRSLALAWSAPVGLRVPAWTGAFLGAVTLVACAYSLAVATAPLTGVHLPPLPSMS